jgi:hypothetical protein
MKTIQAYKRAPALENSTWYKGLLISQLAGNPTQMVLSISSNRR